MTEGYKQYIRKYRILISHKDSNSGLDISNLRVSFEVNKAVSGTPDNSSISICNVSNDTANAIKRGDTVILEAGYVSGNYGMIFSGKIVQTKLTKDETNSALVLKCQDGDSLLRRRFVCKSLSSGISQSDVIDECLSGDSDATKGTVSSAVSGALMPRGKVLFGTAANYLEQVASSNSCQYYVEDGVVNIIAADDYANDTAVELNPMTGLIETPQQTDDGVSAKCLINPSIKLNTMVHISSGLVEQMDTKGDSEPKKINADGVYKITKIKYTGDTHDSDWYCEFEGVTVAGKQVSGNTGDQTNIWR